MTFTGRAVRYDSYLPLRLQRAFKKLGSDISLARRKRRIQVSVMAERCNISRATLRKIETGDPTVSAGSYGMVLFVLEMTERLADLVDVTRDVGGLEIDAAHLPQRIRERRKRAGRTKRK